MLVSEVVGKAPCETVPSGDPSALGGERIRLLWKLFNRLPAMVAYWDGNGHNVLANNAYIEWFGCDPAAMAGVHISAVLGEELYAQNLPYITAALEGEEQHFERKLIDASGRERHTQASYIPDVVGGRTVGFFVLVTEVTDRVAAERAVARSVEEHRALARNLPHAFVLLFDTDLRYRVAEGPVLAEFALSSADLEGWTIDEVGIPELAAEMRPRYLAALRGETVSWDSSLRGRIVSFTVGPVRDSAGEVFAGLVIGSDVTAGRQQEAADVALRQIAVATAAGAAVGLVAERVARSVQELFEAEVAAVARFDGETVEVVASYPPLPERSAWLQDTGAEPGSVLLALRSGGAPRYLPIDAAGEREEGEREEGQAPEAGGRAVAAAPILVNGEQWGALGLALGHGRETTPDILECLAEFAGAVAMGVASAAAWDALAERATTDPLTHLANRRTFEEELARASTVASRLGNPVSVVLLDLDHFKAVNDTYGHPAGDAVLLAAAARMRAVSREYELLARVGGEEFALLLPNGDRGEAVAAAERLRDALSREPIRGMRLTASAGTATMSGSAATPSALVAAADAALYASKRAGRDTVTPSPLR
ncbi:diguanylate cyclase [Acidiferrimicrobium sp. IK]|uniref:sensor domain-containing diguanylate cyclase n=1 Tax=Acidiferrimicrobium sp. IK TaxID=2871700 RepID=UPI0021CB3009|nr:diguanylate cyclase [Acidiferrimicrobium sp. IK]MCU4182841.1 diguanylate cyclase [Acidiferrimicrobium sp. IK]